MRLLSICKALGLIHIIMGGGGDDKNKWVSKRKKRKLLGYGSKGKWQWLCFRWFSAQMLSSVNAQNATGFALTFLSFPGNHIYYTATPPPAEFSILRYSHCSLSWASRNFSSLQMFPDISIQDVLARCLQHCGNSVLCTLVMQREKWGQEANMDDKKEQRLSQVVAGTCTLGRKPREQAVFDQKALSSLLSTVKG